MKRARALVLDTFNQTGNTTLTFPLTPALSLGEREKPSPLPTRAKQGGFSNRGGRRKAFEFGRDDRELFPLLEGEGQGEGERGFRLLPGAT
jgi:hypothetical protein